MILFFSATGNSEYVARSMAAYLEDDRVYSMEDCIAKDAYEFQLKKGETLGIVAPCHFLALPRIVEDFLGKLTVTAPKRFYTHFTCTYGSANGQMGKSVKKLLKSRGIELHLILSVRMVDTFTPLFDVSNIEANKVKEEAAEEQVHYNYTLARDRRIRNEADGRLPGVGVALGKMMFLGKQDTSHLEVEESCISCGTCEARCPVKAIEMKDGKPTWVVDSCLMCLRCLHNCPTFAIQYDGGKKTRQHGQYVHPPFTQNPVFVEAEPGWKRDKLLSKIMGKPKK